jgi:non-specific protein-tyrosine kinase
VDPRRLISTFKRWFPLIIGSVLLAAGVAYVVSSLLPKTYEARATLIVGQSLSAANPDYNQILVSQRLSTTYASIVTKRPALDAVIKELGLKMTSDELVREVRANAPLDSTQLIIAVQDADPARAASIANAMSGQLVAASPAIQGRQAEIQAFIDSGLTATQTQINETQAQIAALNALPERTVKQETDLASLEERQVSLRASFATLLSSFSASASNLLTVVEPAIAPPEPVSPRPLLNTIVAAMLGLLLAAGIIAIAELLYDGISDSDTVLEVAGVSTLGTIMRMKTEKGRAEMYQLAAILYPRSGVAEAYRTLRTNIEFTSVDAPIHTLLVTSSMPDEGKTITAANLAVVFAQAGRRVLLVDADLRKPGVHLVFDLPNAHGLTTLLRNDAVGLDSIVQTTEQENLRILTSGPLPPNPAELTASQRLRTVLEGLKAGEDLVILDGPPLQAVTDSAILSSFVDATLLVIDAQHSRRRTVRQAREALAKADARVIGAVLNRVRVRARSDDASYYGDYYGSKEAADQAARGPVAGGA